MGEMQKNIEKMRTRTLEKMPVRGDPEEMVQYIDAVVCSGVAEMEHLLNSDNSSIDHKIKAFNAVVGAGRFLETRRLNIANEAEDGLIDDLGGLGGASEE